MQSRMAISSVSRPPSTSLDNQTGNEAKLALQSFTYRQAQTLRSCVASVASKENNRCQ